MFVNVLLIVVWMMNGGTLIRNGIEEFKTSSASNDAVLASQRQHQLSVQFGWTILDTLIELAMRLQKMASATFSFVFGFVGKKEETTTATTTGASDRAKEKRIEEFGSRKWRHRRHQRYQRLKRDLLSNVTAILRRGWVKLKEEGRKKVTTIRISFECKGYNAFIGGVVVGGVVVGVVWPLLGRLFWSLIVLVQLAFGFKNTKLADRLGWKKRDADANPITPAAIHPSPTETESAASTEDETLSKTFAMVPAKSLPIVKDHLQRRIPPTDTAPAAAAADNETALPKTVATVPAKSFPFVKAPHQRQTLVDAVWRNCNSDTKCKDDDDARDENRRNASRLRLHRDQFSCQAPIAVGVNDTRRVAPPIDARARVKSIVEEMKRHPAKNTGLLEDEEINRAFIEGEDAERLRRGLATTDDEDFQGPTEESTTPPTGGLGVGDVAGDGAIKLDISSEISSGNDTVASKGLVTTEDDDAATRYGRDEESKGETVKNRIRDVMAELQELSEVAESTRREMEETAFHLTPASTIETRSCVETHDLEENSLDQTLSTSEHFETLNSKE